jgi:CRISP-associated protein Cas1
VGRGSLTADGRRTVLRAYERRLDTEIRHPVFQYRISYRRVLDVQARLLAAVLVGEVPEYIPMVTR